MAAAPVVIPYAVTQLAEGVALDATSVAAQAVFTVPVGMKCLGVYIVFREASTTVNVATTFNVGNTASATTFYSASTVLQSMLTTTGAIWLPLFGSTVATAKPVLLQNDNLTVTFTGTLTSNGQLKVDVIGYLTAI